MGPFTIDEGREVSRVHHNLLEFWELPFGNCWKMATEGLLRGRSAIRVPMPLSSRDAHLLDFEDESCSKFYISSGSLPEPCWREAASICYTFQEQSKKSP